jgi:hypothetical protein
VPGSSAVRLDLLDQRGGQQRLRFSRFGARDDERFCECGMGDLNLLQPFAFAELRVARRRGVHERPPGQLAIQIEPEEEAFEDGHGFGLVAAVAAPICASGIRGLELGAFEPSAQPVDAGEGSSLLEEA